MDQEQLDKSTEAKILSAAKKLFTEKGYNATKIRDIAIIGDVNISLINYHFRSKEKLFQRIMSENVDYLFGIISPILNNEKLELNEKISLITEAYIDMLLVNPDFPRFIINEVFSGSNKIPSIVAKRKLIQQSHFARQVFILQAEGTIQYHPLQVIMNLVSMIIFPFLGKGLISEIGASGAAFGELMEARKRLIPQWMSAMIKS